MYICVCVCVCGHVELMHSVHVNVKYYTLAVSQLKKALQSPLRLPTKATEGSLSEASNGRRYHGPWTMADHFVNLSFSL